VTSAKLFGAYTKLFHARKQCRAIYPKPSGGSILAGNPSFAVSERAQDLLALSLRVLVNNTLSAVEGMKGCFHNSGDFVFRLRSCHQSLFFVANSLEFRERCLE